MTGTKRSEDGERKLRATEQRNAHAKGLDNATKIDLMKNFIRLCDQGLKKNKDHLQKMLDTYGPYSYDLMMRANGGPNKLIPQIISGHEEELSSNPTIKKFLETGIITAEETLQYLAENPIPLQTLAEIVDKPKTDVYIDLADCKYPLPASYATFSSQQKLEAKLDAQSQESSKTGPISINKNDGKTM